MGEQKINGINLVIALPAEAKPLINLLNLHRDQVNMARPVYRRDHIQLIISGAGTRASADGVRYLHTIRSGSAAQWFNIGICGHGSLEVGAPLLVDRIIEQHSGRQWPLTIPHRIHSSIGTLICVAAPQNDYAADMAYDMESSGFIEAVSKIAPVNTARVFKIVSDNPANDTRGISGKWVRGLIEQQCGLIQAMIE